MKRVTYVFFPSRKVGGRWYDVGRRHCFIQGWSRGSRGSLRLRWRRRGHRRSYSSGRGREFAVRTCNILCIAAYETHIKMPPKGNTTRSELIMSTKGIPLFIFAKRRNSTRSPKDDATGCRWRRHRAQWIGLSEEKTACAEANGKSRHLSAPDPWQVNSMTKAPVKISFAWPSLKPPQGSAPPLSPQQSLLPMKSQKGWVSHPNPLDPGPELSYQ